MKLAVYYNLDFSGAKRSVFEQVRRLRALGHEIDVYTTDAKNDLFDPGKVANREYRFDYRRVTLKIPFLRKLSEDLSDFYLLRRLHKHIAKEIDKNSYDICLINTDKFTQAPFVLRYLKSKKVYFCLEPLKIGYEYGLRISDDFSVVHKLYESINRFVRKKIDRDNARASDTALAISYFGRELMIQSFDIYPKVTHLGVDEKVFKKANIRKKNQVLFIGQKLKMNGYDYAVEAIKLIPKNIRPRLKVISISDSGRGRLTDKEIVYHYNESLITLSLSNFDTFGLVPLESLACEVPVIAFNVAAYRETILNKKTGFLVDFDSYEIAQKIIYLLKSPNIINSMGKEGRKQIEIEWTWDRQIKKLEKFLLSQVSN